MKIKEVINKYKPQIIFGAVVALFGVACLLYIVPTAQNIHEQLRLIDETTDKNEILSKKVDLLSQTELVDLEKDYLLVTGILLKDKNPYKIFSTFDNALAKIDANDLSLGRIDFSPGEMKTVNVKKTTDGTVILDVAIKGKYETFLELIKQIEVNYPLMSIAAASGKLPDAIAELNTSFVIYIVPESGFIPSLETPLINFSQEDLNLLDKAALLQQPPVSSEIRLTPQKFDRKDIF